MIRVIRWGGVGLAAFCAVLAGGSIAAQTPEEIFLRGNEAYEQERFEDAVDAYRTVLKYRIVDPRVEFNLGNAEFRLGRLGPAILHFERAKRLDPTDRDVRDNLQYARSFCFDVVEPEPRPAVIRMLHTVQDRLGPDQQAWLSAAVFWAILILLGWGLSGPGRFSATLGWALACALLVLALSSFSWYLTYDRIEGKQLAVVLVESVDVLAGPGDNNATLFTVHEGLALEVRDVRDEWIQVSLPNGLHGWLSSDSLGLV